jgi:hypothetical protein
LLCIVNETIPVRTVAQNITSIIIIMRKKRRGKERGRDEGRERGREGERERYAFV